MLSCFSSAAEWEAENTFLGRWRIALAIAFNFLAKLLCGHFRPHPNLPSNALFGAHRESADLQTGIFRDLGIVEIGLNQFQVGRVQLSPGLVSMVSQISHSDVRSIPV